MERVRYDLLFVINTLTFAVACNSAVWAVLLCVSAHQHRIPFLGIRPSNVPSSGSLELSLGALGDPMKRHSPIQARYFLNNERKVLFH